MGMPVAKEARRRLSPFASSLVVAIAMILRSPVPIQAQTLSPAAKLIQDYYQQLLPTIQQAGRLSVLERDQRFTPAISSAFDFATMTRLAVGPSWSTFTSTQQAALREAFASFIIADYANQVADYSGVSFVVEPQTSPESRGGGDIVNTRLLQASGRIVPISYLVRGGRVIDVYFYGRISDLATRRDEFASIIASGGADALIKRLHDRIQSLLGG